MKRLIIVISILTLVLALAMVGASLMSRKKELKNSQIAISNLEFDLNSCKIIYNDLLNNKQTINKQLEEKTKLAEELSLQIESLQNELLQAEENNTLQQEEILNLQIQIETLQEQLDLANTEIESLRNQSNVIDDRILSYMAIITGSDYDGDFVIPEGVTTIRANAFQGRSNIKGKLVLPSSLVRIESYAFQNSGISGSLIIPDSVTFIGGFAFKDCSNITFLKLGSGLSSLGVNIFSGCSSLNNIEFCENIYLSTTSFNNCVSLTQLNLPSTLKDISANCFKGCFNIESIVMNGLNDRYTVVDNGIYLNSNNTLILGCKNTIILDTTKVIGEAAFCGCSDLLNIYIPNSVVTISKNVFSNCSSNLVIYCGASASLDGWSTNWNYNGSSSLLTYYGYTYEQYLEAIAE